MKVVQRLVPDNKKPKYNVNGKLVILPMTPEYITIHETDNTNTGANADAHSRLQLNGNSRKASWHIQVDCQQAIQSLPFYEAGMHAGDGTNGSGNRKSIGVEICVNSDGDYEKALQNAAEVVGQLMKQFSIPSHKVVPHKHWSGKNCPRNLLQGRWQEFVNRCIAERGKLEQGVDEVKEQKLSDAQEDVRQEAIRLGITDGNDPFRVVNQYYVWNATIPLAKRIEELEKKMK
ncbi:peptidoglycan recognition protein family protein [Cytobacillus solani]|uniref:peptidoglycan recognition protein family protein n=1 Tax=Cytobacillus solani TaxID=1637975 RepID=UPI0006FB62E4|nr:N-acetylmuramoyl-L-alanine amidase [Cytobacillus solani]